MLRPKKAENVSHEDLLSAVVDLYEVIERLHPLVNGLLDPDDYGSMLNSQIYNLRRSLEDTLFEVV
jgi:hypothetical protein